MNQLIEATTTRANPGIDPSLHVWGWEIVVYLFLGGLVAGIFVLAAALELRSGEKPKGDALRLMPFAALALLSVGMGALWLDLAHRLWAWRFYLFFHATSPMSWGAWILVLIYPVGLLLGLGSMTEAQRACAAISSRVAAAAVAWVAVRIRATPTLPSPPSTATRPGAPAAPAATPRSVRPARVAKAGG